MTAVQPGRWKDLPALFDLTHTAHSRLFAYLDLPWETCPPWMPTWTAWKKRLTSGRKNLEFENEMC